MAPLKLAPLPVSDAAEPLPERVLVPLPLLLLPPEPVCVAPLPLAVPLLVAFEVAVSVMREPRESVATIVELSDAKTVNSVPLMSVTLGIGVKVIVAALVSFAVVATIAVVVPSGSVALAVAVEVTSIVRGVVL